MVLPFFIHILFSAGYRSSFDESLLNLEKIIERKCISRTVEIVGYYSSRFEPIILLYWLLNTLLHTEINFCAYLMLKPN